MRKKGLKCFDWGSSVPRICVCYMLFCAVLILAGASGVGAQTQPPSLFFTDLTVVPNTGNTDTTFSPSGNGAYVTLYGNNFGSTQGSSTVTWNGQNCLKVLPATGPGTGWGAYTGWGTAHLWYQKIIVQVMSTCTPGTGSIVVTTPTGTSNGLSLTVNAIGSNHIYFASSSGSSSNSGTFQTPLPSYGSGTCLGGGNGNDKEVAGDICYAENGANITGTNGFASMTPLTNAGTATLPIAYGTYPGANVSVGTPTQTKGIEDCVGYSPQCNTATAQYMTLFGFGPIYGVSYAVSIQGTNNRVIATQSTCPNSPNGTETGCLSSTNNYTTFQGNEVYGTGANISGGCGKLCEQFYVGFPDSGSATNFEVGWNSSHDANGGRLLQFYNGATSATNVSIHDNLMYNNIADDGMTVDANPDAGYVNIYNNVIYNVCQAPEQGDCDCMYLQDTAGTVTTPVQVYNNSGYRCSNNNSTSYGMISAAIATMLTNNIFYATISGEPCVDENFGPSHLSGSNNIWYGCSNPPTQTTGNITTQPTFMSLTNCGSGATASCNLAPASASSPQIGAGMASWAGGTATTHDFNGLIRPSPPSIGAFEMTSGTPPTQPNPPTNLSIVVN